MKNFNLALCIILIIVFLTGCEPSYCLISGSSCSIECSSEESDKLCSQYTKELREQTEREFACSDEVDDYIKEKNLTSCDKGVMTSKTIEDYFYECCRTCIQYNPNGSDSNYEICKQNRN